MRSTIEGVDKSFVKSAAKHWLEASLMFFSAFLYKKIRSKFVT